MARHDIMRSKGEAFARHFRKSYGWSKQKPDPRRCAHWVSFDMQRLGKEQCLRPNGSGQDGAFCQTHAALQVSRYEH